jgi:hypothetical protein
MRLLSQGKASIGRNDAPVKDKIQIALVFVTGLTLATLGARSGEAPAKQNTDRASFYREFFNRFPETTEMVYSYENFPDPEYKRRFFQSASNRFQARFSSNIQLISHDLEGTNFVYMRKGPDAFLVRRSEVPGFNRSYSLDIQQWASGSISNILWNLSSDGVLTMDFDRGSLPKETLWIKESHALGWHAPNLLSLGLGVDPSSVRWTGQSFSGLFLNPFSEGNEVSGQLVLSNGTPFQAKLSGQRGSLGENTVVTYAYSDIGLLPETIDRVSVLTDGNGLPIRTNRTVYRLLEWSFPKRAESLAPISPMAFIEANRDRIVVNYVSGGIVRTAFQGGQWTDAPRLRSGWERTAPYVLMGILLAVPIAFWIRSRIRSRRDQPGP